MSTKAYPLSHIPSVGAFSGASEPVPLHASAKLPTAAGAPPTRAGGEGEHPVRDDQMLVPREAWQRAMEQLGHFHELAEKYATTARELGKLETSEAFLRERLALHFAHGDVV